MSDIDWENAPEGADYYSEFCGCYFKVMFGRTYTYMSDGSWDLTLHKEPKEKWISKPTKLAQKGKMYIVSETRLCEDSVPHHKLGL